LPAPCAVDRPAPAPPCGARAERAPERRTAQRNGYRPRAWDTRVGEIELAIPRLRSGPAYLPSFLEPRRRAERALVAVVQEAYINGVSTRKVDRLVEQLGLHLSKDQVSGLCRALDEQVEAFRRGRWRAPTRTCGSMRSSKRSAIAARCARRRW
jgi:transposase-like protein